jgi:hypothetical protein
MAGEIDEVAPGERTARLLRILKTKSQNQGVLKMQFMVLAKSTQSRHTSTQHTNYSSRAEMITQCRLFTSSEMN